MKIMLIQITYAVVKYYRMTHLITACFTTSGAIVMVCLHFKVKSYYDGKYA